MAYFRFTIKHDNGKDHVKVLAHDIEQATSMIIKAAGCPATAIIKIKEVK